MDFDQIIVIYSYAKKALTLDWETDKTGNFSCALVGAQKLMQSYDKADTLKFINYVKANAGDVDGFHPFDNRTNKKSDQIIDMMTLVFPRMLEASVGLNINIADSIKFEKILLMAERQRLATLKSASSSGIPGVSFNNAMLGNIYKKKSVDMYKSLSEAQKDDFDKYVGNAMTMFMRDGKDIDILMDGIPSESYVVGNVKGAYSTLMDDVNGKQHCLGD